MATLIEDILEDVANVISTMEHADREVAVELGALRAEFTELEPDPRFHDTLALFDEFAQAEPAAFTAEGGGGRAAPLLAILRQLDAETRPTTPRLVRHPEQQPADPLAAWRARLAGVLHRYFRALRSMRLRVGASAGLALLKLDAAVDALNPPDVRTDANGRLDTTSVADLTLFNAVWSESPDMALLQDRVAELRGCVERVGDELCVRLGTTRSRAALVQRFKHRCEWHDRERMLAVANEERLAGGGGGRLTGEVARYLFDAGLNPVTRLLGNRPAPTLLDPRTTFYVEAAQYTHGVARDQLPAIVDRALHAMRALRAGGLRLDDGWLVVLRCGGPRFNLPELLRTEDCRLHLTVIDLTPVNGAEVAPRQCDRTHPSTRSDNYRHRRRAALVLRSRRSRPSNHRSLARKPSRSVTNSCDGSSPSSPQPYRRPASQPRNG